MLLEVTLLRDAGRRTMVEAIDLCSRQLRQGGVAVFSFAGHGAHTGSRTERRSIRTLLCQETL